MLPYQYLRYNSCTIWFYLYIIALVLDPTLSFDLIVFGRVSRSRLKLIIVTRYRHFSFLHRINAKQFYALVFSLFPCPDDKGGMSQ
jgi:hypothetical protein